MNTFEEIARWVGTSAALTTGLLFLVGAGYKVFKFVYKTAKYAERVHDVVEKQLSPNGGSSMYDMVTDIKSILENHDNRLIKVETVIFQGEKGEKGDTGMTGARGERGKPA